MLSKIWRGLVSRATGKATTGTSRRHFVGLDDIPYLTNRTLLGRFVNEQDINWPHVCVMECAGYDPSKDSFLYDLGDENEDIGYWDE